MLKLNESTMQLRSLKDAKENIDDFICEMQSELAKTYSKLLLSNDQTQNFNAFIQS
jgi:hypothetical protein